MSQPHETLVAWQRADDLCVAVFSFTNALRSQERYDLGAQLRRAALSVPANIAEGYAFPAGKNRIRHLRIAVGSLAEVGYYLHLAGRLGLMSGTARDELQVAVLRTAAPLHGLIRVLQREPTTRKPGD